MLGTNNSVKYGLLGGSIISYLAIGYLFPRTEFLYLIACFTVLFFSYFLLIQKVERWSVRELFLIGMALRLLFLPSIPTLSDDFYRYLWDGQLIVDGIHPFDFRPYELIDQGVFEEGVLFKLMNSPKFYSVYPPTNQLIFTISAWLGQGDWRLMLVVLKVLVISAEGITLFAISRIGKEINQGVKPLIIYALNPLVIVEFSGNAHSEAIMVSCMALFILLLIKRKWVLSSFAFSLAICSKLLPVLVGPLLIKKIGWKKTLSFGLMTLVGVCLLFIPLFNQTFLSHFGESLQLYFKYFEFNGLFFLIAKYVDGYWVPGALFGLKLMMLVGLGFIYWRSHQSTEKFFLEALLLFTAYFLVSSTIHPWYVAALVFYACFTPTRYLLIWTALLPLSYFAYKTEPNEQSLLLLIVEYGVVVFFLWKDIFKLKQSNS